MTSTQTPLTVEFFRNLLKTEKETLEGFCADWREISKLQDVPQNVEGDIFVAVGQAELLMRQRFVQFSGLIDDCELKRGEKETTCQDLQGFWDIVNFQIEDIKRKFRQLSELQKNSWETPKPKSSVEIKKAPFVKSQLQRNGPSKPKVTSKAGSSAMRAHILAARQKLKDAAAQKQSGVANPQILAPAPVIKADNEDNKENIIGMPKDIKSPEKSVFDAGFFKVVTPVKKLAKITLQDRSNSAGPVQKLLSSSVLRERVRNMPVVHKDYSPCMRITRSMKAKGVGTKLIF